MCLCDFIYACIVWILYVTHIYTYMCASPNKQQGENSVRPAIHPFIEFPKEAQIVVSQSFTYTSHPGPDSAKMTRTSLSSKSQEAVHHQTLTVSRVCNGWLFSRSVSLDCMGVGTVNPFP